MDQIIANGLDSVRVGLEDFQHGMRAADDSRLTSAVRNIYAGILILAKGKLYALSQPDSPGILIRVMRPKFANGRIELMPDGRKTIEYEEIKQRLKYFGLSLDWARIERIRAIRNDLEHFYHDGARTSVQEALADSAIVIRSLLSLLNLDPIHDLGEKWWGIMLTNEQIFSDELASCRQSFSQLRWLNESAKKVSLHFSCEQCGSRLIRQTDPTNNQQSDLRVECSACGTESGMKPLMERAVTTQHYRALYEAQTQGGERPVVKCPKCGCQSMILAGRNCAVCGYLLEAATPWCDICGNPFSVEEAIQNAHKCPPFNQD